MMERHPEYREVLIERMACGCRLEWQMRDCGSGPGYRILGVHLHGVESYSETGRLFECPEHASRDWEF